MIWKTEELENMPCDFCGAVTEDPRFTRADGMRVVECRRCGLAYIDPRPRQEFIARFYDPDYFTGVSAGKGKGGLKCSITEATASDALVSRPPRPVALIKERLGGLNGKDVLEIGCATGDLLTRLKREGARVRGLEISEYAANIARKRDLAVTTGTIEQFNKDGEELFDLIIAFEVIEHVPSPSVFLAKAVRLLRPGGQLLLSTPNYACAQRYGTNWFGFTTSFEHIYFFSREVLDRMSSQAGFTLTYWESSTVSGDTSWSPGFLARQVDRIARLTAIGKEIGFRRAMGLAWHRALSYLPFGDGHTILVVLQKRIDR